MAKAKCQASVKDQIQPTRRVVGIFRLQHLLYRVSLVTTTQWRIHNSTITQAKSG